ncbi:MULTISPECIES: alpha/beta hydrolase [unclassified Marinobacter]|jgi:pimeloyl-ACP methyl ester carboxylesterase|uniref:alpha/beta fold hydrolase n=1 Tax=unclassified Marinobacter TaxID=83889 RepID=UPI000C0F4B7E|nr:MULTISPECIES: alpha/beta hydrolase [unclassified Marinobacter]MAB53623.1 alpha/beta hydrolase [Marinobacter sp.]PHQ75575.1 MAG: alpha/beta hydrolase [Marinobacter sp.]|tara:strand:+ start:289 stop:1206 length:918 start_codon:yes stop_codon:yes gene_type:complete
MNDTILETPPDTTMTCREINWSLKHIDLAGLHWPAATASETWPVLMIHGWLDNALSFARLAPALAGNRDVYSLDMAGHGRSGHRPEGQGYQLMDYVADLAELVETHFKDSPKGQIDLVGHSLGGIVSVLYAAGFPERVRRLVMIDSIGPISRKPDEVIDQMRKSIIKRMTGSGKAVVYPDIELAAKAREGGMIPLSPEAARMLVTRGMKSSGDGFVWQTDPRLRHPSMIMMDEAQVTACLKKVVTPTRFLRATQGLLASRPELDSRLDAIANLDVVAVPGGHHCHLDGNVEPVIDAVRGFLDDAE